MSERMCKNTAYQHENHYGDRYNGYCLECSNAGVAELHDRIWELEARLGTALCCSRCGREPMRERGEQVVCTECVSELEDERDRLATGEKYLNELLARLRAETDKRKSVLPGSPKLIDELIAQLEKVEAERDRLEAACAAYRGAHAASWYGLKEAMLCFHALLHGKDCIKEWDRSRIELWKRKALECLNDNNPAKLQAST